jgi:hypothetical protein
MIGNVVLRLRPLVLVPLFVSSVCIVLLLRMSMEDARYLVPTLFVVVVTLLPALLARRRIRRVLESGDVHGVLRAWQPTMDRVPHPETMAPLMIATAYASHGWLDAARTALAHAVKGPTWEAAREQRLFIEALLCTFEGEQQAAMAKAHELEQLPLPSSGPFLRRRVTQLRQGVAALVRAFGHKSDASDETRMARAASASPLVYWAMRYGEAIVAFDHGERTRAKSLIATAPTWPAQSAFASFHAELMGKLE